MKTKKTKATDISQSVKKKVWERDGGRCVVCGSPLAMPSAHFVARSHNGKGIEQNIVTLCTNFSPNRCHYRYDFGTKEEREKIRKIIKKYLQSKYENWNEEDLIYHKWED